MSDTPAVAIITDSLQLSVLAAILTISNDPFGLNLQAEVNKTSQPPITLVELYETLIDLIELERVVVERSDDNDPRSRKLFFLKIPSTMEPWSPFSHGYPGAPVDWDRGDVLHLFGGLVPSHGINNDLAWEQDGFMDGTDIIAYTKTPSFDDDRAANRAKIVG